MDAVRKLPWEKKQQSYQNEIVAKATCPKLAGRYASADEFRSELRLLKAQ